MRTLIFTVLVLFTLVGCSKYQFVAMESSAPKSEMSHLIRDYPDYTVRYNFSGMHGPVRIEIFNKTSHPLYFKWHPSARLKDEWPSNNKPIFTAASGELYSLLEKPLYGKVEYPVEMVVVGPDNYATSKSILLREVFFHISSPEMRTGQMNGDRIRKQHFSRQNTPLFFLSDIECSLSPDFSEAAYVSHEFWVSEVAVSMTAPEHALEWSKRDDAFHLRKGSGMGFFLFSIGLVTYFATAQIGD
jgi:hypothetical protein